jgi:hypothetical protein
MTRMAYTLWDTPNLLFTLQTTRTLPLQHSAAFRCVFQGLRLTHCAPQATDQQDKAHCEPIFRAVNRDYHANIPPAKHLIH